MKKILIVVGTGRNPNQSTSYKIAEMIKVKFQKMYNDEFEISIISLSEYNLDFCNGCLKCFMTGECSISDDISILKEKVLEATHIMFMAPVYIHGVPGIMKNFMDRLAYWTHILKLLGKTASAVAVASSNGLIFVTDYMKKVLELMGAIYIDGIGITVDEPPMLQKEKDLEIVLDDFVKKIADGIKGEIDLKKIEKQSGTFELCKKRYANANVKYFETEQWQTDEDLLKSSYLEAYRSRKRKMEASEKT